MARLFGTDGVRGVANADLSCELATKIGRGAANALTRHLNKNAKIIIARDTRISGEMLEQALAAGICSAGADAVLLGVLPTPAVAYLVKLYGADAGVMITASHNPVQYNGIKIFNSEGFKLADDIEDEIEELVKNGGGECDDDIGRVSRLETAARDYSEHVSKELGQELKGLKIVFDCANGAASETAKMIFEPLGCKCVFTGDEPDGHNINEGVGSTHLEHLKAIVSREKADVGIAFDGDADRCLAVDENGDEIDGDKIIAMLSLFLKEQDKLSRNTVVVTVMSNLGFMEFARNHDIKVESTVVGDRYVLEEMRRNGYKIGGEQSGHVILFDHATTGDGELTALALLAQLKNSGKKLSELAEVMQKYPQVILNVAANAEQKARFKEDEELEGFIQAQQQELFSEGRVLVRASGTEPCIRIMVEGKDKGLIESVAWSIKQRIEERI